LLGAIFKLNFQGIFPKAVRANHDFMTRRIFVCCSAMSINLIIAMWAFGFAPFYNFPLLLLFRLSHFLPSLFFVFLDCITKIKFCQSPLRNISILKTAPVGAVFFFTDIIFGSYHSGEASLCLALFLLSLECLYTLL
jgi:hypothetical protein